MALPLKINKTAFDKLSDDLKNEYKLDGSDYVLDVTGLEDTGALTRANERLRLDNKDLKDELGTVEKERDTLKAGQSTTEKDVSRLQKKYEKDTAELKASHDAERAKDRGFIDKLTRRTAAQELAKEISTVPALMTATILEKTRVNYDGDEPVLEWIGADGAVSTREKIQAELVANKEFSPIIRANPARGGGAVPGVNAGAVPAGGQQQPAPNASLAKVSPSEMVAHIKAKQAANPGT